MLDAKEAEGRLHGSAQARDNGMWRSTVAVGEVLGGREASLLTWKLHQESGLSDREGFFLWIIHMD